jgi:hypothetical protein
LILSRHVGTDQRRFQSESQSNGREPVRFISYELMVISNLLIHIRRWYSFWRDGLPTGWSARSGVERSCTLFHTTSSHSWLTRRQRERAPLTPEFATLTVLSPDPIERILPSFMRYSVEYCAFGLADLFNSRQVRGPANPSPCMVAAYTCRTRRTRRPKSAVLISVAC